MLTFFAFHTIDPQKGWKRCRCSCRLVRVIPQARISAPDGQKPDTLGVCPKLLQNSHSLCHFRPLLVIYCSAAALNVTEPGSCGLGGDVFCLYWNAKEKTLKGINGSGRSPKALTLAKARELGVKGKEM